MARAAGFEAAPVLVSRRSDYFFNHAIMNEHELNDNVVQVKVAGRNFILIRGLHSRRTENCRGGKRTPLD